MSERTTGALAILALVLVVGGFALMWPPLGLVVGGALILAFAWLGTRGARA